MKLRETRETSGSLPKGYFTWRKQQWTWRKQRKLAWLHRLEIISVRRLKLLPQIYLKTVAVNISHILMSITVVLQVLTALLLCWGSSKLFPKMKIMFICFTSNIYSTGLVLFAAILQIFLFVSSLFLYYRFIDLCRWFIIYILLILYLWSNFICVIIVHYCSMYWLIIKYTETL